MNADTQKLRSQLDRYYGFLKQDQANPGLRGEVADLHLRLGELTEARKVLEEALSRWPEDPGLKSRLASVSIAQNKPDEAIALLQGLQQSGADHPIVRYNLAYAMMFTGRYAEAKELLLTIVADAPQIVPQASLLLARALHHLGEVEEAIKHTQYFLTSNPDHAEGLGVLALLGLDSDDSVVAKESAEKAIGLDPNNLNALVTLGSLALAEQDDTQASGYFDRAVERHPKSGRAWSGKGLSAMLGLDLTRALDYFQRAVEYMPNHIGTWHSLAWCQILSNDLNGALQSFNKAMDIDRNFGETHGGLAVVAILQNRLEEAPDMIRRALRLDPGSFAGRFAQSLLTSKSDPKKAQQMIEKILMSSAYPGGEPLRDVLTRVTLKKGGLGKKPQQ